ncbi:MAG: histidinol-phosphatase HisJ family protein [Chitinivibrionales bacterium]|nr:histidinol-phosphatase HisJ family protein [Chitinivibrionales bacterium]MBD3357624.1 histidinol-phosphatase HisJ family protein [Chitinivibrionales bacterium]
MEKTVSLPADYHVHTAYCGHAHGKIVDYVESAIRSGIREICFADHLGRYYLRASQRRRHWDWGMDSRLLGRYFDEIDELRQAYCDKITIRVGLEIDYIAGAEDILKSVLAPYSFDFLLASIHCVPSLGWKHLANYGRQDSWTVYQAYFDAAKAALRSGLFDSLAHLDFIWRYVKWPESHDDDVAAAIQSTVATAHATNTAVEINANALLWSQVYTAGKYDPFSVFLDAVEKYGAAITVGSDAHKPEFVAKSFSQLAAILKKRSIGTYCTYRKRRRIPASL